jgi:hypothetical protein
VERHEIVIYRSWELDSKVRGDDAGGFYVVAQTIRHTRDPVRQLSLNEHPDQRFNTIFEAFAASIVHLKKHVDTIVGP